MRVPLALCRWWDIELAPGIVRHGMVVDVTALAERLQNWRNCLCNIRSALRASGPPNATKQLPRPQLSPERQGAGNLDSQRDGATAGDARRLAVRRLFRRAGNNVAVTAQRLDIDVLRQLAARLELSIAGIVPDASALAAFLRLPSGSQGLAWRNEPHWLWATREGWGSLPCAEASSFSQLSRLIDAQSLQPLRQPQRRRRDRF